MNNKKEKDNLLSENIYERSGNFYLKSTILFTVCLFLGLVVNFPLRGIINDKVNELILSNSQCPITAKSVELSTFMTELTIKSPKISNRCIKGSRSPIKLDYLKISLSGPSFYPIGIKLHIKAKKEKSIISAYPSISVSEQVIKIEDSVIDASIIKDFLPESKAPSGKLVLNALFKIKNKKVSSGQFLLKSKNLVIPSQSISGFNIPSLPINNILIKTDYNGKIANIKSIIVGDDKSPINLQISGKVTPSKYNFVFSKLNLAGEIKFSQKLLTDFPIINMLTSGKKAENGYYKLKIKGTFANPTPTLL